jgi:hypothetical protein
LDLPTLEMAYLECGPTCVFACCSMLTFSVHVFSFQELEPPNGVELSGAAWLHRT